MANSTMCQAFIVLANPVAALTSLASRADVLSSAFRYVLIVRMAEYWPVQIPELRPVGS